MNMSMSVISYFLGYSEDFGSLNLGYADWYQKDGLIVEGHTRHMADRFRLQAYEHLVKDLGLIESMEGKTLLETGCGRGGGLRYLAKKFKPRHAVGIDYN